MSSFFIQLVLILLSARFLGEFVARFKVPSVIGELLAGVILGPSLLGWVQPSETIKILADIGIVFILFEIGLETDLTKLAKTGLQATVAAIAGVIAPFVFGYGLSAYVFHMELLPALFIGATLTATSIGITLRVLGDLKRQHSHEARVVLGAAIIDDIIGIVLLWILYEFSVGGEVNVTSAGKVLLFIALFLLISPILVRVISSLINRYDAISEIPGLLPSTIVSLLLLFAWLAHECGAPELLGGFAAGLALSKSFLLPTPHFLRIEADFSHRVEEQMRPIIHLFSPIFFVNIGLSLNLNDISWDSNFVWLGSLTFLAAAIVGKLASGAVLWRESSLVRWAVGLSMIPRGEVGLIFADIGKSNNVFNQDTYAIMIIVIALTTMCTPIALRWLYSRYFPNLI